MSEGQAWRKAHITGYIPIKPLKGRALSKTIAHGTIDVAILYTNFLNENFTCEH